MIGDTVYQCSCGSRKFMELYQVRKYAGGGMGKIHAGYKCQDCGKEISGQAFSKIEEIRLAKQKMKEAEETLKQLGDMDGAEGISTEKARETAKGSGLVID